MLILDEDQLLDHEIAEPNLRRLAAWLKVEGAEGMDRARLAAAVARAVVAFRKAPAGAMPAEAPAPSRILVDEIRVWSQARSPFLKGSCHLTVEGDVVDLHAFARGIGCPRGYFHRSRSGVPHYDITPARREKALARGAVYVPALEQARARRARRQGG